MVEHSGNEDLDFVYGQMYGIRSFKVTTRGLLTAVTNSYIYQPGENKAGCTTFNTGPDGQVSKFSSAYYDTFMDRMGNLRSVITHAVAKDWCSCGFYGYYHRVYNQYGDRNTVTAIVAAYGRVSYSNYGFRASKLKLVAAVNPYLTAKEGAEGPVLPKGLVKKLDRATKWSRDHPWYKVRIGIIAALLLNIILTCLCLFFIGGAASDFYQWYGWVVNGLFFTSMIGSVVLQERIVVRRKRLEGEMDFLQTAYEARLSKLYEFEVNKGYRVSAGLTMEQFALVAKHYPEIKWYKTVPEMLAAHSLTKYEETPGYERNEKKKKIEKRRKFLDGWPY